MQLLTFRPSRWVGLALLWLLASLAGQPAAATSLFFKPVPASVARIMQGNINRLEYFVDADPGIGNGTAVPLTPGTDVSGITFSVNLAALTTGFHRLSTRVQDAGGVWSLTNTRSFYYQPASTTSPVLANITKAEYFIDAEPGLGNGINIPVATPATDVSGLAFTVDLTPLTVGFHRLTTRSRDANGMWSLSNTRSFYYQPASATPPAPANITRVEYYFDTDPGFGSATSVPVPTPAPDVANLGFAVDLSTLADGAHRLFIRSRDANGKWSLVSNAAFTKSGCASSANFAASLPAASYVGTSTSGTFSSQPSVAFNTDPASPTTGNAPYFYTAGSLQADMGTAQTISEVRVRLTAVSAANSTTIQIQTAASAAGPFTTIDTYTAPLVANTPLLVARKLATPVSARVLRLQFQNSNTSNYVLVSGAGAFNFQCLTPSITSLTPNSGPVGTSLTVTGANLQGTSLLTFAGTSNNTVATGFTVSADGTQLTGVVVPSGATTGNVTATTPNGTSNGVNFTVLVQPSLASLAPASGVVGATIALNGANLGGTTAITFAGPSNNTVTSGFTVNSAGTQITGVVVPSGAQTGSVTVTTPGGTSNGVTFTVATPPAAPAWATATAFNSDGPYSNGCQAIARDASGNRYITGTTSGTTTFGATTITASPAGSSCMFVLKLTSSDSVAWVRTSTGPTASSTAVGSAVAVDAAGNVYVTGSYAGVGSTAFGGSSLSGSAANQVFVTALDNNGNFLWTQGGTGAAKGIGIATDTGGNVFVTGANASNSATHTLGSFTFPASSATNTAFMAKLAPGGAVTWAVTVVGAFTSVGRGVATDASGNAYFTGSYTKYDPNGNALGPKFGTYKLQSPDGNGTYVTKINSAGTFQWVTETLDYTNNASVNGYSIAIGSAGDLYLTGYQAGTSQVNWYPPGYRVGDAFSAVNSANGVFIEKLNSAGFLQWHSVAACSVYSSRDDVEVTASLAQDASDNTYVTGYFAGSTTQSATFGNTILYGYGASSLPTVAAAKLLPDGTFAWAKRAGGSSYTYGLGAAVGPGGTDLAVVGRFSQGTANFDALSLPPLAPLVSWPRSILSRRLRRLLR